MLFIVHVNDERLVVRLLNVGGASGHDDSPHVDPTGGASGHTDPAPP
jgi:hypothetical protein